MRGLALIINFFYSVMQDVFFNVFGITNIAKGSVTVLPAVPRRRWKPLCFPWEARRGRPELRGGGRR